MEDILNVPCTSCSRAGVCNFKEKEDRTQHFNDENFIDCFNPHFFEEKQLNRKDMKEMLSRIMELSRMSLDKQNHPQYVISTHMAYSVIYDAFDIPEAQRIYP